MFVKDVISNIHLTLTTFVWKLSLSVVTQPGHAKPNVTIQTSFSTKETVI